MTTSNVRTDDARRVSTDESSIDQAAKNVLRANRRRYHDVLPDPGTRFLSRQPPHVPPEETPLPVVEELMPNELKRLKFYGILESEDSWPPHVQHSARATYSVVPAAAKYLKAVTDTDDGLPCCGARGFRNLGDVDGDGEKEYRCASCGQEHDRATVEEVTGK